MNYRRMKQADKEEYAASSGSAFSGKGNMIASILFAILCVLFFLPVLLVLIISVSSEESVTQIGYSFFPQSFSLDAWRFLLRSGNYLARAFLNSVVITASGTVLGLILMCPIAYALSRKRFRLRRGILVFLMIPMLFSGGLVSTYMVNTQVFHLQNTYLALILPYFLSWVIVGYCLYGFLATDEGQVNHILRVLGGTAIQWYQSPGYWRVILILIEIWKSTGYAMVIYLCAITAIDRSLYEGAVMDGATFLQRVRYITLPMLRPTIATIFILRTGSILASDFGLFYQVPLNSNSLQPVTQTLDVYVYKALMQQANFSYSAAASFLQNIVGCALLLLANTIIRRVDEDSALG